MSKFSEALFATKTVSVWGIGYLGYTTILRLQSKGFFVNCFSFDKSVFGDIKEGKYPYEYMKQTWSENSDMPRIDIEKVKFCEDTDDMFDVNVHIIALPAYGEESGRPEAYSKLTSIFGKYLQQIKGALIVFQAAEKIGTVENYFIKPLKNIDVKCFFASAFRSDWNVEEFLAGDANRIIASNDKQSLEVASEFFNILGVKFSTLSRIDDAEIYENSRNCLRYSMDAFFAQLSFAYPGVNINEVSSLIIRNIDFSKRGNGLNLLNRKHMLHIEHILAGQTGDYLSIVKETQSANMTTVLFYADILKQKKILSITIMGLSVEGTRKDIRASAAILLAEYLNNMGVAVFIHDPCFTKEEIAEILPFAIPSEMKNDSEYTESYVVMSQTQAYNYMTQADIQKNGLFDARVIIDGVGVLKHFSFSSKTIYHEVGDGRLKALVK